MNSTVIIFCPAIRSIEPSPVAETSDRGWRRWFWRTPAPCWTSLVGSCAGPSQPLPYPRDHGGLVVLCRWEQQPEFSVGRLPAQQGGQQQQQPVQLTAGQPAAHLQPAGWRLPAAHVGPGERRRWALIGSVVTPNQLHQFKTAVK